MSKSQEYSPFLSVLAERRKAAQFQPSAIGDLGQSLITRRARKTDNVWGDGFTRRQPVALTVSQHETINRLQNEVERLSERVAGLERQFNEDYYTGS